MRTLMERLFAFAGVKAPLRITDGAGEPVHGLERMYYTLGAGRVFGIKKELGAVAVKYDGLAKNTGDTAEDAEAMHVRFPDVGHLYDIRGRKYLGYADALTDTMKGGDRKYRCSRSMTSAFSSA